MLSAFTRSKSKQERLWDACSYGREETVKKLLIEGANVNWRSHIYECCPVHIASQGKPAVLKMLLDAGCHVDVIDANGNTALHHAAMSGLVENVLMLLNAGASVDTQNQKGWTALFNSAYWNHFKVTAVLLSHMADPFAENKDGRLPLHELCRSKSRDGQALVCNVEAILDGMAVWNSRNKSEGAPKTESPNLINIRCKCTNELDFEADFTPLMFACYHGHLDLTERLLRRGADINASAKNGWTALHWAAQRCHADIVELLLDHGASRTTEDLRGDMPCDVTNDIGLRECLFPDPQYPNIVSNGYATTDEEDEEAEDYDTSVGNQTGTALVQKSSANNSFLAPLVSSEPVDKCTHSNGELSDIALLDIDIGLLKLAVSERFDSVSAFDNSNISGRVPS